MAEAFLRTYAGDSFEVYSAGFEPKGIHPLTIQVMEEAGISLKEHSSKALDQYLGKVHFGIIITVCSKADEMCPVFPGLGTRLHWPFEDPADFQGSDSDQLLKFRDIRDQIQGQILDWLKEKGIPVKSL